MKNLLAIVIAIATLNPLSANPLSANALSANPLVAEEISPSVAERFEDRNSTAVPDFQKHVVPLLGRLGCNSAKCHGSFQGQGGLRFSLFGFDFEADHSALHAEATSEEGNRLRIDAPRKSLFILKASEQIVHEGGKRLELNSWEHHLLMRWVESGAKGAQVKTKEIPVTESGSTFTKEGIKFYEDKIQPLLENNCYECHGFNNRKGNFQLHNRDSLLVGGDSGEAIVSGKPETSLLIEAIQYSNSDLQMPPSGKLKKDEIADIEAWVRRGVPWSNRYDNSPARSTQVLAKLHFEPEEILFRNSGDTKQIKVIAEWQNGEREDVTCLTRFHSNNDTVVNVSVDGIANSAGEGDTHIVALYDNGVVAVPVLRPYRSEVAASETTTEVPTHNQVDRFVNEKLSKLALKPSAICSDAEFLRRVNIDMTGSLPTPQEVSRFLADVSEDKRLRKIDELLSRSSYAAWWANKLCDFTGCNPASIRGLLEVAQEEGYVKASLWYDWIYQRVAENEPYDDLVEGIMLAELSSLRSKGRRFGGNAMRLQTGNAAGESTGMPYFWDRQSLKEPKDTAMSVAHSFLGIQLQCAECHKHPFDQWTQTDFNDFSRFFENITPAKSSPGSESKTELSLLRSHVVSLGDSDDPRQPIMDWMRNKNNPWFARAFVNRVWAGYFHVGIVDPPDQFTPANPPSNPQLLDWLTEGFIEHGYDMKWLHRQIASSDTYQRSWIPNETNRNDLRNFSRAIPRRIPAEVIYDAMKQATAATDKLIDVRTNLTRRASGHLSMRMAGTHAMRVFGKPDRSINCDCERVNEPTLLQSIFLQNDPLVRMRLADSGWIIEIEDAVADGVQLDRRKLVEEVWLRTVGRPPSEEEISRSLEHLKSVESIPEGVADLMWAMLNTKEFLLNH